jgi:hypothetical protein
MRLLLLIIMILSFNTPFCQTADNDIYRFAKEVFRSKKYQKKSYQRFNDKVEVVDGQFYHFGDKVLTIELKDNKYKEIFSAGIFNPDIVFGQTTPVISASTCDSLSQQQKVFYNLSRNDSLSICCLNELTKINPDHQTRRFVIWVWRKGMMNPTEYYFELFSNRASASTTTEEFIRHSKMTFYYQGTILL